ncbi:MAG: hypothetical protein L6R40_000527 [Gallowayella cf. fulva]|nr:MAG: hypothetical protein L6R40_000527 [Xanthomendoza cf. fulva]
MTRGNAHLSKVHYQGKDEDFIVYVDDVKAVQDWKDDRSTPLAQVVSQFKIFVTHKYHLPHSPLLAPSPSFPLQLQKRKLTYALLNCRHGAQNAYDEASKLTLENEFGSQKEEECMIKILEGGTMQETEEGRFVLTILQSGQRQGPKNDSMGPRVAH